MSGKYCFGIDVGGTTVKCGLFDAGGEVLDKWEVKTRTQENGRYILPDVAQSILAEMDKKAITKEEVIGIGIGVPGPVTNENLVDKAVNLHWDRIYVADEMTALTGIPTKAGNDANVAALGEQWRGGGQGFHSLIMVTLGTGVGGGIIINDRIHAGSTGSAGEIGHAHVDDDLNVPCNCGNCGCLEQFASATGIARLAREELAKSDEETPLRGDNFITAKEVFDAVKAGDPVAERIAERFGTYLGKALAIFATVADPEAFVIGGGVSKAGPILLDYIQKNYEKYAFHACRKCQFRLATLGNDAGIYGAARMVL